ADHRPPREPRVPVDRQPVARGRRSKRLQQVRPPRPVDRPPQRRAPALRFRGQRPQPRRRCAGRGRPGEPRTGPGHGPCHPADDGATIRIDGDGAPGGDAPAGWQWVSFSAHTLTDGSSITRAGDGREVGVVVLEGEARVSVGGRHLGQVGSRASVFDEVPAPVVLVEPGQAVEITALGAASIALAAAPGGDVRETRLIDAGTMRIEARGSGRMARTVRHLLPAEEPAGRLLIVEVITPGGNWSSYPPHKHDTDDPPRECLLEEL